MEAMNGHAMDISTPTNGPISVRSSPLEATTMDIEPAQEVHYQIMASSSRTLPLGLLPENEKEHLEKQVKMLTDRLRETEDNHWREKTQMIELFRIKAGDAWRVHENQIALVKDQYRSESRHTILAEVAIHRSLITADYQNHMWEVSCQLGKERERIRHYEEVAEHSENVARDEIAQHAELLNNQANAEIATNTRQLCNLKTPTK